ncbi:MAG: hypothetical protein LUD68_09295 [Rikenellaceae bacterium]|nr:hypothetical protein [Rikenellaceae bacterium]
MTEKLIVVKSHSNQQWGVYRQMIVPDARYYRNNRGSSVDFTIYASQNGFSGVVLYFAPDGLVPIRADRYRNGDKTNSLSAFGENYTDYCSAISQLSKLPSALGLYRCSGVATRGFEDNGDDWDWDDPWGDGGNDNGNNNGGDWWDFDGYKDIGNGFFIDSNGNVFYDSNGDGKPDSMWVDPVEVPGQNPNPPGLDSDPDPFPTGPEDNNNDNNEGNSGGTPLHPVINRFKKSFAILIAVHLTLTI